jgi:UDP-N-acetylglucosamine diphosphorylase / glucose-1-phosphate thymidylyltransferase / UDP-N-acetylgalactosamine diphosphorylase / glucosamine-1-phosphate N-acetyltransferase / galactosamine-1-phosphate N-acetyltransferase
MTQPGLPLELFNELSGVWQESKLIKKNCFDLLGAPLKEWIAQTLEQLGVQNSPVIHGTVHPQAIVEGSVYIAEGATIGPFAYVQGPCIIGPNAEVRHAAFIRGNVYVGQGAVVGHTTEVKGSIFLDEAKAGHFAYIGDSILGRNCNLGAGTKLANLKLDNSNVRYRDPDTQQSKDSGLRKFGAIIGEHSQIGCNAVLSPGSLLQPRSMVMPCEHYHNSKKRI